PDLPGGRADPYPAFPLVLRRGAGRRLRHDGRSTRVVEVRAMTAKATATHGFDESRRSFGQRPHDHQACVAEALDKAALLCDRRGARLTELRLRVLELVWRSHAPVGAYEVLGLLQQRGGKRAAPPTVYRALDFLLEHGLIHRLESLNA